MNPEHAAPSHSPELIEADLAPDDAICANFEWSGLSVERVRSSENPLFMKAYDRLWREFGALGELERKAVLASRLRWDPAQPINDHALLYEMLVVRRGPEIVGVRDHTAIVPLARESSGGARSVIVHLSHVLVEQALRGSGLAGWLRALPLQTARECAARAGASIDCRITLVAEMEAFDDHVPATAARLRSYGRAGFLTIDPSAIDYHQPDFRDPEEIDRTSIRSLPLTLLVRRVGREPEKFVAAAEVRGIIDALYTMYATQIRTEHMSPLWAMLDRLPDDTQDIALKPPLPT